MRPSHRESAKMVTAGINAFGFGDSSEMRESRTCFHRAIPDDGHAAGTCGLLHGGAVMRPTDPRWLTVSKKRELRACFIARELWRT